MNRKLNPMYWKTLIGHTGRWVRQLERAQWWKFIPKHQRDDFEKFMSKVAYTPGLDQIVIRWTFTDSTRGEWYAYASYKVAGADAVGIRISQLALFLPREEVDDGDLTSVPEELQGLPIFDVEDGDGKARKKVSASA